MKVLIGDDGSEVARRAARTAVAMLAPGAHFTVLRVCSPSVVPLATPIGLEAAAVAVSQEALDVELDRVRHEVRDFVAELGVDAEGQVESGSPGPVICDVARAGGFSLVVVGSHGSGLLKQLLLGSVSHHVVQHAPCPVFLGRNMTLLG